MFTGIITDVGTVRGVTPAAGGADTRLEIATAYDLSGVALGASIACSGVCLTVVDKGADWFAAEASAETLSVTTLGRWAAGGRVNLERALKVGEELGGHIVQGHVDAVGAIADMVSEGGSTRLRISCPGALAPLIAPKGSIAVDGVSLTVNEAGADDFTVNIIPHTWSHTAFHAAAAGDAVNLEIDVLARYVARLKSMS